MEKTTKWVICWLCAGALLAACALGVLAYGLNHSAQLKADPAGITAAAEEVLDTVRTGKLDSLKELLSGNPKIGTFPEKDDTPQSMLWYAYLGSLNYELSPEFVLSDNGADVTVSVTCLDISAAMDALPRKAQALLEQKAAETTEESDIYDAKHNVHPELAAQLLHQAAAELLADAPQTMEQEITLRLIRTDGLWQVVPGDSLTKLLSGFVTG